MNRKKLFLILFSVGFIIISILAFTLPNNPNQIIPALTLMSCDKPLWLCIIFGGSVIYAIILYAIYDKLDKKS